MIAPSMLVVVAATAAEVLIVAAGLVTATVLITGTVLITRTVLSGVVPAWGESESGSVVECAVKGCCAIAVSWDNCAGCGNIASCSSSAGGGM